MSFNNIETGIYPGREKLINAVKMRTSGGSAQIVISRDIADAIGISSRVHVAIGSGTDAGWLRITPAAEGMDNTYRASTAGKKGDGTVIVTFGVKQIGWSKLNPVKTVDVQFVAGGGAIRLRMPRVSGASTHASITSIAAHA